MADFQPNLALPYYEMDARTVQKGCGKGRVIWTRFGHTTRQMPFSTPKNRSKLRGKETAYTRNPAERESNPVRWRLVRAARKECDQHHEVGQREQPLIGLSIGGFCGAGDEAQVTAACEVVQVIGADAGQAGNFRFGENFLARLNLDHGRPHDLCRWRRL